MARRRLNVGATVQLAKVVTACRKRSGRFCIEALLQLDDGSILYKVKSETEPFDRIVAEYDIAPQP